MAITARDFSSWMSHLSDDSSISSLTLPGTHNTCALYGWPLGTCQTRTLSRQLKDGIRFLDLRLGLPKGPGSPLTAYHGFHSQSITFTEILKTLINFVTEQPSETIIISIKQEDKGDGFKESLMKEMIDFEGAESFKNRWWIDDCLPQSLGLVRGKLILFSRIESLTEPSISEPEGIRLPSWPNNSREIWETKIPNTNVAVQDWYDIGSFLSISKKSSLACLSLCRALWEPSKYDPTSNEEARNVVQTGQNVNIQEIQESSEVQKVQPETDIPTWVITFLSASSPLLAFPVICAKGFGWPKMGLGIEGVNSRVSRWLVSRRDEESEPSIKGVVCLMDYYQSPKESLVSLLVDCNF
ncbi:PLC-like phosphodiesterase [Phakopsora pachyrhizi]|nr:PLC-like phosphodiesterase [Phakopsora pachyrhizi]